MTSLNELNIQERTLFLRDMSIIGDVLLEVCSAERINYDILGNTDNFLHAHIFPRYKTEPSERRVMPVWLYSSDHWHNAKYQYDPVQHGELRQKIADRLIQVSRG